MNPLGAISYSIGTLAFLVLALLLLTAWRGRLEGGLLVIAAVLSVLWSGLSAAHGGWDSPPLNWVGAAEILRNTAWLLFLTRLIGRRRERISAALFGSVLVLGLVVAGCLVFGLEALEYLSVAIGVKITVLLFLGYPVAGLVLVEQLYRNTLPEHRWGIKYLSLGLGAMFAYDFFLYSNAALLSTIDGELWIARGFVAALVVPFIAVSISRNPDWSVEIFVSRHIVFHSAAIVGAGAYLLIMAGAGYYLREFGGTWGRVAQAIFLFGSALILMLLMFSGQLRSRGKVFLSKHFFKNKYDYRQEWLKFTQTLSSASYADLRESVIRAVSAIVESPGGVMWLRRGRSTDELEPMARWVTGFPLNAVEPGDSPLISFLTKKGWTIFLDEFEDNPEHYEGLSLPAWLRHFHEPWVIVPLLQRDDLIGFLTLSRSKTKTELNWEDSDLLKTVGRQAASYLALAEAHEALSEASQFEAFNRLSSFVVHDLKNLTAQLSLVVSNAKRHLDNPAFVEDAVRTVENATGKMNRLLAQLKKGRLEETQSKLINLRVLLQKVVAGCALNRPVPTLECHGSGMVVRGDPDRLAAVFENLVNNAQEATPGDGRVTVRLSRNENDVVVDIMDNGRGMTPDFIRERLFKPFDTTKGNAGMGIGVFEARATVTARGGTFQVKSAPGQGTTFTLSLPSEADDVEIEPLREASV